MRINEAFALGIRIEADEAFHCDRSLNGQRFAAETGVRIPGWREMIDGLRNENGEYDLD